MRNRGHEFVVGHTKPLLRLFARGRVVSELPYDATRDCRQRQRLPGKSRVTTLSAPTTVFAPATPGQTMARPTKPDAISNRHGYGVLDTTASHVGFNSMRRRNRSQIASSIPQAPPVTTATLPSSIIHDHKISHLLPMNERLHPDNSYCKVLYDSV